MWTSEEDFMSPKGEEGFKTETSNFSKEGKSSNFTKRRIGFEKEISKFLKGRKLFGNV